MRIAIYFALIIIAIAFFGFICSFIMAEIDDHEKEKRRKADNEYNQKMINKCKETQAAKSCHPPKMCKKCAWNTRMHDGVIEFKRSKP